MWAWMSYKDTIAVVATLAGRNALKLACLYRGDDLMTMWVLDAEREAVRDLVRAREDAKVDELKARQRFNAFLLHHSRGFNEGKRWWPCAASAWSPAMTVFLRCSSSTRLFPDAGASGAEYQTTTPRGSGAFCWC